MTTIVSAGVIGLGSIGKRHISNIKSIFPKCRLVAMSSSGASDREHFPDVDVWVNQTKQFLLYSPDFVIIASPAPFHYLHSLPLIEAGIPILIEKPLCTNYTDIQALAQIIETHRTPVAIGYCMRYSHCAQKVKEWLTKGYLGNVRNVFSEAGQYLPDWRRDKDYKDSVSGKTHLGGGVIFELSHELDFIGWFVGDLKLQYVVKRHSGELEIDGNLEDLADILLTAGKTVVNIHLDFLQHPFHRFVRIVGQNGIIEWDIISSKTWIRTYKFKEEFSDDNDKVSMYQEMLIDFIRLCRGQTNNCVSLAEGAKAAVLAIDAKNNFTLLK